NKTNTQKEKPMRILLFGLALALIVSFIAIYPEVAESYSSLLTLNSEDLNELPRMFHMTPLKASGSSQFSRKNLQTMIEVIPGNSILIVDLREEPHGFMNGSAISWYKDRNWLNAGKTKEEIIKEEHELLHNLSKRKFSLVFKHRAYPMITTVHLVMTEEELAKRHGIDYLRMPVRDHVRPSDKTVDEFVELVKQLPEDVWLHFHCSAGKGRTTTFLSMYDMMLNAKKIDFDEIITRQESWGGVNLLSMPEEEEWKHSYIQERAEFIRKFYRYCVANPDFSVKWSEWISG
ncbi:MAG: hypothetical protein ACE5GN_07515, partial [Waddliaceae bacterium]